MTEYDKYLIELKQKYNVGPEARTYMETIVALNTNGMTREEFDHLIDIWVEQYEK